MANTRSPRQYTGVRAIHPPDLTIADRAPAATDTAFLPGQLWLDKTNLASYQYSGTTWIALGTGALGGVATITGDSGGAQVPLAGNFNLKGTPNQITVTGTANTETFKVPTTFISPGTIASTTTLTSGTSLSVTTSALIGTTLTATGGLTTLAALTQTGTTLINSSGAANTTIGTGGTGFVHIGNTTGNTSVTGSLGTTTTLTGGTGITATTGNIVASAGNITSTLGSVGAATTVTAGTAITATLGAITATNGNLVLGTAGNKIISSSVGATAAAGDNSFGKVTLVGGTVVVATTAVTANSIILLTRQSVGATGAAALGMLEIGTIVAGTSFVINANTTANSGTLVASDVSVVGWMIIN